MGINVLYVEDNPDNMILVKRVMENAGFTLFQAATGLEGLAIAEKEPIDIILLDINLPDIDGYEVARRLRHSSKSILAHTPIIAITANALKGDAESALAAGCDVYMSKPVNIHELRARVEGFVPSIEARTKPIKY
jgi:two-component system, cell cycle response regulator DivK